MGQMDAFRIKAARYRLWRAWVFGGLVWSVLFVGLAALLVWLLGFREAQTFQLALIVALAVCGGIYGFIYIGAAVIAVIRWAIGRQRT